MARLPWMDHLDADQEKSDGIPASREVVVVFLVVVATGKRGARGLLGGAPISDGDD
jgi:hypothetical protein